MINNPIQKTHEDKLREILTARATDIASILPRNCGMDELRFRQMVIASCKTQQLRDCDPMSIAESALEAAALGMTIGGPLGQSYLVPYKKQAQFQLSYRGMGDLLRRSGEIKRIESRVVFDGDEFSYSFGLSPTLIHTPRGNTSASAIQYAYAIAHFADGTAQYDVMTLDELMAIQDRSKSRDASGKLFGPWVTDSAEMCKKTVVRRLCKMLPMSADVRQLIERDDERTIDVNARVSVPQTTAPPRPALSNSAASVVDDDPSDQPFDDEQPSNETSNDLELQAVTAIDESKTLAELKALAPQFSKLPDDVKARVKVVYGKKQSELSK